VVAGGVEEAAAGLGEEKVVVRGIYEGEFRFRRVEGVKQIV
jgi:hypothetical protein